MRRAVLAAALAAAGSWSQAAGPAAAPKPVVFKGAAVELSTKDGWKLAAKHLAGKDGSLSFVLLHGTGGRKEDWVRMGNPLARRGYGYLAVDLRAHGESRTAPDGKPATWRKLVSTKAHNDYLDMAADVEAAVAYLTAQGVPEERIAIIGADVGSSLGLRYAALHPKVPLVALLSPRMQYQDVTAVNALRLYKDRPILMVYSEADKTTAKEVPVLKAFAEMAAGPQRVTVLVAPTEHGTKMLRGPVIGQLLDWIENPIKPEVPVSSGTVVSTGTAPAPSPAGQAQDAGEAPDPGEAPAAAQE